MEIVDQSLQSINDIDSCKILRGFRSPSSSAKLALYNQGIVYLTSEMDVALSTNGIGVCRVQEVGLSIQFLQFLGSKLCRGVDMDMLTFQYCLPCPLPGEGLARWLASNPCSSREDGREVGAQTACRASFAMALLSSLDLPGRIIMFISPSYILDSHHVPPFSLEYKAVEALLCKKRMPSGTRQDIVVERAHSVPIRRSTSVIAREM